MKNIYQRINEVRSKLAYIKKDATVSAGGGSYAAVTHDQVTAQLHDLMVENGIMTTVDQQSSRSEWRQRKSGADYIHYEGWYSITFINIEEPDDRFSVSIESHADDSGDKAPGKACSYAVKVQLLKTFFLETGVSDESRLESVRGYDTALARLVDEVNEYLDHNDALAIMLLAREAGQDMWSDVYNSAPSGKKTEFKKALTEAEKVGHEIFKTINQGILKDDPNMVLENIEDLTDGGKRLLAKHLGSEKVAILKKMKEAAE